jgi:hypothetical protein
LAQQNENGNLFYALYRWAHRQGENFTTEAFAYLLRCLLKDEPSIAVSLLMTLTNERLEDVSSENASGAEVRTQVSLEDRSRPDMEIRTPGHLIYVEVKDESDFGHDQRDRYAGHLVRRKKGRKATLVLLTRYGVSRDDIDALSVKCPGIEITCCRWLDIAGMIQRILSHAPCTAEKTYLLREFLEYLKLRRFMMEKVTWELESGVTAAQNLFVMLSEALSEISPTYKSSFGRDWGGYYVNSDKSGWVGIVYGSPQELLFHSWGAIDEKAARAACAGCYSEDRKRWELRCVLDSEEVHFFSLTAAHQLDFLKNWLGTGMQNLNEITKKSASPEPASLEADENG